MNDKIVKQISESIKKVDNLIESLDNIENDGEWYDNQITIEINTLERVSKRLSKLLVDKDNLDF